MRQEQALAVAFDHEWIVYELDADLKPIRSSYLGDAEAIAKAAAAVANQGKAG